MLGPLTYLDVALIALCVLSGLLAMAGGALREVLSISSWALAAGATLFVLFRQPEIAEQLTDQLFGRLILAQLAVGVVVFLVVLLVSHFIVVKISNLILESGVGIIDRLAGLGFGVVRGFLLVTIAYAFFDGFAPADDRPDWVTRSYSLPYLQSSSQTLVTVMTGLLPEDVDFPGLNDEV